MINMNELIEDINDAIKSHADELNEEIEKSIAYEFLSGEVPAYEINHSYDPPWDHSGIIVHDGYIDANSTTFDEYLKMYNGESYPSFFSGCGMFHRDNQDCIDEMMTDWAFNIQRSIISEFVLSVDRRELYDWLMKNKYHHYVEAKTYGDFVESFDKYENSVYDSIVDFLDGDTIAFCNYEIVKLLAVFKNNPLIAEIVEEHRVETIAAIKRDKREAERQRLISAAVHKDLDEFVATLRKKLPNTNDFFKGRRITREKENSDLRKEFFSKFTREEISIIAYFESYRFSNSMLIDLPNDAKEMIESEKMRLREIYEQKYPPEYEV